MQRIDVKHVVSQLAQRFGGLPEEGGLAASLRAEYDDGPPRAFLGPLHHLRKGAVPIDELDLEPGEEIERNPPHV